MAALVAAGRTTRKVAAELYLGLGTVEATGRPPSSTQNTVAGQNGYACAFPPGCRPRSAIAGGLGC